MSGSTKKNIVLVSVLVITVIIVAVATSCSQSPTPNSASDSPRANTPPPPPKKTPPPPPKKTPPPPPKKTPPPAVPTGEYVAQKNTDFGTSIECYSIKRNGDVELRHNGLPAVNDRGKYRNGEIVWNSGRIPSKVSASGDTVIINGTRFNKIGSC